MTVYFEPIREINFRAAVNYCFFLISSQNVTLNLEISTKNVSIVTNIVQIYSTDFEEICLLFRQVFSILTDQRKLSDNAEVDSLTMTQLT